MSRLAPLPPVMLAPNGARRTKADHPALPVSIAETVAAAQAGFAAGAQALHAHVRDAAGGHSLDAGLYRELIAEMGRAVPAMPVQITTEAVGLYDAAAQRAVVRAVQPEGASVALREMWPGAGPDTAAQAFYASAKEAGVAIQHILYTPADAARLAALLDAGALPPGRTQCLLVLGAYAPPRAGAPGDLAAYRAALGAHAATLDWAVCAFGAAETACLWAAMAEGGKIRVGFENNLTGDDGAPAVDNAARVRAVLDAASPRG